MVSLSGLKVRSTLFLGFGILIVIAIISSVSVYVQLGNTLKAQESLLNVRAPTVESGIKLSGAINQTLSGLRGYLILGLIQRKLSCLKMNGLQVGRYWILHYRSLKLFLRTGPCPTTLKSLTR